MSSLPQLTPKKLTQFFLKQGFIITRQTGSHMRLIHPDGQKITIAVHNKPISPGTFQSILKQAQLNREEFLKLYSKK